LKENTSFAQPCLGVSLMNYIKTPNQKANSGLLQLLKKYFDISKKYLKITMQFCCYRS
jgi:hypothetical protein